MFRRDAARCERCCVLRESRGFGRCVHALDDYVSNKKLSRVNVIKMDIEGSEMAALEGAFQVIREFKPRLAISAYHRPEDLWEIPHKLKTQNGDYRLLFGHHSPVLWESVYYAASGSFCRQGESCSVAGKEMRVRDAVIARWRARFSCARMLNDRA